MNVFPTEITENIKDYILGGNSYFCIRQKNKGIVQERWFCVRSTDDRMYFVHVNDGGKNKYLGYFYKNNVGKLKELYIKTKKAEADQSLATPLIRVLNRLENNDGVLWDGVQVVSDGRCSRCGRRITDFESMAYGLGPVCRKKLGMM